MEHDVKSSIGLHRCFSPYFFLSPFLPFIWGVRGGEIAVLSCVPIMQMRSVSVELEILGRHQHPELTIPFLKVIFLLFSYSIYLGIFGYFWLLFHIYQELY